MRARHTYCREWRVSPYDERMWVPTILCRNLTTMRCPHGGHSGFFWMSFVLLSSIDHPYQANCDIQGKLGFILSLWIGWWLWLSNPVSRQIGSWSLKLETHAVRKERTFNQPKIHRAWMILLIEGDLEIRRIASRCQVWQIDPERSFRLFDPLLSKAIPPRAWSRTHLPNDFLNFRQTMWKFVTRECGEVYFCTTAVPKPSRRPIWQKRQRSHEWSQRGH
jgi:hypothetical protein